MTAVADPGRSRCHMSTCRQGLSKASQGPFAVFSWVKPESPWGRHFLRACQKRSVRRCKREKFQGFENFSRFYGRKPHVWYCYIRRRFPVSVSDLRTL
jgi:hypothetical protein